METFFVFKVSALHLQPIMKQKIIDKATDLFLTLGFKSVTMDHISNELGISKKTIYQHFPNKTKLVESTVLDVFYKVSEGIECICTLKKNPIEEIYDIKNFVKDHLKDEKSSPQFQLQKYYPKIFNTLKQKQYEVMSDCVKENLTRGINLGLYRKNLNIEIITRLYFNTMITLKDQETFPLKNFSMNQLMDSFLEYHVRGICTTKGTETLEKILKDYQPN